MSSYTQNMLNKKNQRIAIQGLNYAEIVSKIAKIADSKMATTYLIKTLRIWSRPKAHYLSSPQQAVLAKHRWSNS